MEIGFKIWYLEHTNTIYRPGAAVELVGEVDRYKMKCVAITRIAIWEEAGTTKISKTTIVNGRNGRGHKLGTVFAVRTSQSNI